MGDIFALQQTALKFVRTSSTVDVSVDSATNAGGATVTIQALPVSVNGYPTLLLKVPALGISQSIVHNSPTDTKITSGALANHFLSTTDLYNGVDNINYTSLGVWSVLDVADQYSEYGTLFITGFHTPLSGMPTTGTATYSNIGGVSGFELIQGQVNTGQTARLSGDGSLTANFAGNTLSGSFTNMKVNGTTPWNNVALTGTISGASVSGTTSVSSTPSGALSLAGSATGTLAGGFMGPNADEIAIIWGLQDASKSTAAGTFGALKDPVPSDARLKEAIEPVGKRADGLQLYSWRYLGGSRRFTGVLAQEIARDPRFAGAVHRDPDGLMRVDYAALGLVPLHEQAMRREGERAVALFRAAH